MTSGVNENANEVTQLHKLTKYVGTMFDWPMAIMSKIDSHGTTPP